MIPYDNEFYEIAYWEPGAKLPHQMRQSIEEWTK